MGAMVRKRGLGVVDTVFQTGDWKVIQEGAGPNVTITSGQPLAGITFPAYTLLQDPRSGLVLQVGLDGMLRQLGSPGTDINATASGNTQPLIDVFLSLQGKLIALPASATRDATLNSIREILATASQRSLYQLQVWLDQATAGYRLAAAATAPPATATPPPGGDGGDGGGTATDGGDGGGTATDGGLLGLPAWVLIAGGVGLIWAFGRNR